MAKSRKKPGCLRPIITIAMAHPVARSGTTTEDPKRTSQIGFVSPTAFPPLSSPDKSGGARTAEILQCSLFIQPHSRSHVGLIMGLTIPPSAAPRLSRSTLPPSCGLHVSTGAEIETALCILESAPYVRIKP